MRSVVTATPRSRRRELMEEATLDLIRTRRSIRKFTGAPVDDAALEMILEAGRWAPSGLNNQPWRFAVIRDASLKEAISKLTHYGRTVLAADLLIPVFLDREKSYHREKDCQGIGACLQNMLLAIHSFGLGAVWLGEIIKSDGEIRALLCLGDTLELMAVLAVGHPAEKPKPTSRRPLEDLVVFRK
jgi:nitroreductase